MIQHSLKKRLFAILLGVLFFLSPLLPVNSQSIAVCAANPACAAELGLITIAAVSVAVVVHSNSLSNTSLGVDTNYSSADIRSIQDSALSQYPGSYLPRPIGVLSVRAYASSINSDGFTTLWSFFSTYDSCYAKLVASQPMGGDWETVCQPVAKPTWDSLSNSMKEQLLATSVVQAAIKGLVSSTADTAVSRYAQIAVSAAAAAVAAGLAGDTATSDSQYARAAAAAAAAIAASFVAASPSATSTATAAKIAVEEADQKRKAPLPSSTPTTTPPPPSPSPTPSTTPTPPPFADDLINKSQAKSSQTTKPSSSFSFSKVNFLEYAVSSSGFGNKFPFGMFALLPASTPMTCPTFNSWGKSVELCFIRDIISLIKYIIWVRFAIYSFVSL